MNENSILNGQLTLEMIYHPGLAQTYRLYQYIIFILSTIMMLITGYVILKKSSPEMRLYKRLLINQLVWSYLFDLTLTLWQPVNLVPYFMCYSLGIVKLFGPNGVYSMYCIMYFMYGGLIQSIIVSLVFRVSRLYRFTHSEYGKTWVKIAIMVLVFVEIMVFSKFFGVKLIT